MKSWNEKMGKAKFSMSFDLLIEMLHISRKIYKMVIHVGIFIL